MSEPSENALDDILERLAMHPVWGQMTRVAMIDVPRDPSAIKAKLTSDAIAAARGSALEGLEAVGHTEIRQTAGFDIFEPAPPKPKRHKRSECYPFPDYR